MANCHAMSCYHAVIAVLQQAASMVKVHRIQKNAVKLSKVHRSYRGQVLGCVFTGKMTRASVKALKEDRVLTIKQIRSTPLCYNNTTHMQHKCKKRRL